jgi:hypothetical protein
MFAIHHRERKGCHIQNMHKFTQINVKYLEESEGSVWIISKPIIRHIPEPVPPISNFLLSVPRDFLTKISILFFSRILAACPPANHGLHFTNLTMSDVYKNRGAPRFVTS